MYIQVQFDDGFAVQRFESKCESLTIRALSLACTDNSFWWWSCILNPPPQVSEITGFDDRDALESSPQQGINKTV